MTMCKDPGVRPTVYEHHIKVIYGVKMDHEENKLEEGEEIEDLESQGGGGETTQGPALKQRSATSKVSPGEFLPEATLEKSLEHITNPSYLPKHFTNEKGHSCHFCEKCNLNIDPYTMQHCRDC